MSIRGKHPQIRSKIQKKKQQQKQTSTFLFFIWIISRHENRTIEVTVQIWTFFAQGLYLTIRFIVDNYFFTVKREAIENNSKFEISKGTLKKNTHIHININEMDLTYILLLSLFLSLSLHMYCRDSGLKRRELIYFLTQCLWHMSNVIKSQPDAI